MADFKFIGSFLAVDLAKKTRKKNAIPGATRSGIEVSVRRTRYLFTKMGYAELPPNLLAVQHLLRWLLANTREVKYFQRLKKKKKHICGV